MACANTSGARPAREHLEKGVDRKHAHVHASALLEGAQRSAVHAMALMPVAAAVAAPYGLDAYKRSLELKLRVAKQKADVGVLDKGPTDCHES